MGYPSLIAAAITVLAEIQSWTTMGRTTRFYASFCTLKHSNLCFENFLFCGLYSYLAVEISPDSKRGQVFSLFQFSPLSQLF